MGGFIKAARLEFKQLKASKANLLLLLLVPIAVTAVFSVVGSAALDEWNLKKFYLDSGTFFDAYAPALFSVIIFFITSQLTILRIVGERSPYGTLDRDLLAISRPSMYLGKLAMNMLVAMVQCALLLGTAMAFGVFMRGNPVSIFLLMCIGAFTGLSMGLMFSALAGSKEQAVQLIPLSLLVLLVMSGLVIEFNSMPNGVREIAEATPLALSMNAIMMVMLAGQTLGAVLGKAGLLFGWGAVFCIIGLLKFSMEK